jgi:transcriptional regulator with PAS, ATPase and Fis domain
MGILEYTEAGIDPVQFEQRLQDATQAYRQVRTAGDRLHEHPIFEQTGFVGRSSIMAELLQSAVRAAEISDVPVLIYGETGTGKQLLAETIHRLDSKRRGKRFQTVNCAAIAGPLAESALFGHIKGAFTGATENRQGYFRAADGGTILLDEIGETALRLQAKLLRVLQEGFVLPVGSDDEYPVDVRVIAATNRRLDELVERRKFRLDLYNRLNVICIEIPPLRERPEDVPPLIDHLLEKYRRYARRPVREVDPGVYDVLQNAALQGNVRELENIIRQTLAFKTGGDRVDVSDLPRSAWLKCRTTANARGTLPTEVVRGLCDSIRKGTTTLPEFLSECERVFLSTALDESVENTRLDLAKQLGLSRRTLYNKRRRYGL